MHTRKIKSAAKTALFYGVDGSRTRNAIFFTNVENSANADYCVICCVFIISYLVTKCPKKKPFSLAMQHEMQHEILLLQLCIFIEKAESISPSASHYFSISLILCNRA